MAIILENNKSLNIMLKKVTFLKSQTGAFEVVGISMLDLQPYYSRNIMVYHQYFFPPDNI